MNGYIKVHRGMLDWEWYADANTKAVFLHLLLTARHNTGSFRGYPLNPGDVVTGLYALSEALDLSVQSVRTALNHLKSTNEITIKATNKFSVVTLVNWEKYQTVDDDANKQNNTPSTNDQQTINKRVTTTEERKKERRKEERRFTPPSVDEVSVYCRERGNTVDPQTFVDFYASKGWKVGSNPMKDWKACVRTWEKRDGGKSPAQKPKFV